MIKDPTLLLDHILESITLIEKYVDGIAEDVFLSDVGTQDKVIRRLSVIGEAVAQLPETFRLAHPHVKWGDIIGMRNFLIHEYFGVTLSEVWLTVKRDLPELRKQIEQLKKDL